MTEPNREPGGDPTAMPEAPAAPADVERPTFQTAASEAVDVAAQAVARQVAATAAANAAAQLAAAEAAAAREAEEAARAAELDASMAAAPSFAADGPAPMSGDPAPVVEPDASMAAGGTVPTTTGDAATMPMTPAAPVGPDATAVAAPAVVAQVITPRPSRRPVVLAWLRRFVVVVLSAALLVGGIVLGSTTFQRTRVAVPAGGGEVELTQPPADVAKEFIAALAAGDSDAIRSALSAQPNKDITDEFTKFGIKKVMGVDTLGTSVDGPRSATEVLLHTVTTAGSKFDINLIILVNGNTIEGFR